MQKQKIETEFYLVLQSNYDNIEIALCNKNKILNKKIINKKVASKDLILNVDFLLKENNLNLKDLKFAIVNQGPAPFTTLRVVIATVNALNFNGNLPIIGIDALDAIVEEYSENNLSVALLNAFNQDVYFAIKNNKQVFKGCKNIIDLIEDIKQKFSNQEILFFGNAVELYKDELLNNFDKVRFLENNPHFVSIEQIAKIGFSNWTLNENIQQEVFPLYLKDAVRFKKENII